MQEMWVPSLGQEDFLEEEVSVHSSFLAGEIAWTEEPGHLQSIELQRVGHNWACMRAYWTTSPNHIVFDVLLHTEYIFIFKNIEKIDKLLEDNKKHL